MTFKNFFGLGLILAAILVVVKTFFVSFLDWELALNHFLFWGIVIAASAALSRRVGVINVFEAFIIAGLWLFFEILGDLFFTSQFAEQGFRIFIDLNFLIGYLLVIVSIFFLHKKRHVQVRKEIAAKK